jgi:predicted transcriptional regulator
MNVKDLISTKYITVLPDMAVSELMRNYRKTQRNLYFVIDREGLFLGYVKLIDIVKSNIPIYVEMDESLAGVINESSMIEVWQKVKNLPVSKFITNKNEFLDKDDSLIKATNMLTSLNQESVAVVSEKKVIGEVSLKSILELIYKIF